MNADARRSRNKDAADGSVASAYGSLPSALVTLRSAPCGETKREIENMKTQVESNGGCTNIYIYKVIKEQFGGKSGKVDAPRHTSFQ